MSGLKKPSKAGPHDIVKALNRCERGATMLEYALIAALIAVTAIVGVGFVGIGTRDTHRVNSCAMTCANRGANPNIAGANGIAAFCQLVARNAISDADFEASVDVGCPP